MQPLPLKYRHLPNLDTQLCSFAACIKEVRLYRNIFVPCCLVPLAGILQTNPITQKASLQDNWPQAHLGPFVAGFITYFCVVSFSLIKTLVSLKMINKDREMR